MQFGNVITGEIRSILPSVLEQEGATIQGATLADWAAKGWRQVVEVAEPTAGFRVVSYAPQEIDGMTCRLIASSEINIADEQAAQAIAAKDGAKSYAGTDIVIRALCALLLAEINTLRQKAGLSQYTATQFKTALDNKIDALT